MLTVLGSGASEHSWTETKRFIQDELRPVRRQGVRWLTVPRWAPTWLAIAEVSVANSGCQKSNLTTWSCIPCRQTGLRGALCWVTLGSCFFNIILAANPPRPASSWAEPADGGHNAQSAQNTSPPDRKSHASNRSNHTESQICLHQAKIHVRGDQKGFVSPENCPIVIKCIDTEQKRQEKESLRW